MAAWFVAFYSFKGGVGRTLALANVAHALAARGKRVVVVDLDLEAPSLHRFPGFAGASPPDAPGFLAYAAEYARTGRVPPHPKLYDVPLSPDPDSAARARAAGGRLSLLPAGRLDPERPLDWRRLHRRAGTLPFVAGLREAIVAEADPHYVLIDSRTGLSDVGGLSTHLLADQVVLLFNLTHDCLTGTTSAWRALRAAPRPNGPIPVVLVASPVPRGSDSVVRERIASAAAAMSEPDASAEVLRFDYDPEMVLADTLAVHDAPRFRTAAADYEGLRTRLQRENPGEVFSAVERAEALRTAGQFDAAVAELRAFTTANPDNADGFDALGTLLLQAGRAAESAEAFRDAARTAPRIAVFHRRLGEALVQVGRAQAEEALAALKQAGELGDDSRERHLAQARAFELLERMAEAIEARGRALAALVEGLVTDRPSTGPGPAREEFVALLRKSPPYAGFDPGEFWDLVFGSFSLAFMEKGRIVGSVARRALSGQRIAEVRRVLLEEDLAWRPALGEEGAAALHTRLGGSSVDPGDPAGMRVLLRGDRGDAAVLKLYAHFSGRGTGRPPADLRVELLEQAVAADPTDAEAWDLLGSARFEHASEARTGAGRLRSALHAYQEAVRVRPGWPRAINNCGIALCALADEPDADRGSLLREACGRFAEAVQNQPDDPEVLYNWGYALRDLANEPGADTASLLREACGRFAEALRHNPADPDALYEWGTALVELAEEPNTERGALLREACGHFADVVRHRPDDPDALYEWGAALTQLAEEPGEDRRTLLREACEHFSVAFRQKPDAPHTLLHWGIALGELAQERGADRAALLREASEKFAEAVRHEPDSHVTLTNWGLALSELANEPGTDRAALLREACERYAEAVRHKPDSHEALSNWGWSLRNLANEPGADRISLLRESCDRFAEALRHNPEKHEALAARATSLLLLFHELPEPERPALLEAARADCLAANRISPGSGDYNLACVESLAGNFDAAETALASTLEARPSALDHALADRDLARLFAARPALKATLEARHAPSVPSP